MMQMTKRLGVPMAALAGLAAMFAVTPSAGAAPSAAGGQFILFRNDNYRGGQRAFFGSLTEFFGQRWNNGQSMQNFTGSCVGM